MFVDSNLDLQTISFERRHAPVADVEAEAASRQLVYKSAAVVKSGVYRFDAHEADLLCVGKDIVELCTLEGKTLASTLIDSGRRVDRVTVYGDVVVTATTSSELSQTFGMALESRQKSTLKVQSSIKFSENTPVIWMQAVGNAYCGTKTLIMVQAYNKLKIVRVGKSMSLAVAVEQLSNNGCVFKARMIERSIGRTVLQAYGFDCLLTIRIQ